MCITTPGCCRSTSPRSMQISLSAARTSTCAAGRAPAGSMCIRGTTGWARSTPAGSPRGTSSPTRGPSRRRSAPGGAAGGTPWACAGPEPPRLAAGGDAWLESTPPVLAPFQALAGLEITLEIGVERIREYGLAQKRLLKRPLPGAGAGEDHGAFVTLRNAKANALAAELAKDGIKTDARGEHLRICPDMLNPRSELEHAARVLKQVLAR